jgi:hypothetical protein
MVNLIYEMQITLVFMDKNTTELTEDYIREHPQIKNCLKKGLVNYSSLARLISSELRIEKSSSKEAILMAARRFSEKLKKEVGHEERVRSLLSGSEIDIKNRISVIIFRKSIDVNEVLDMQKGLKAEDKTMYLLEGSDNYTMIIQGNTAEEISEKFRGSLIARQDNLALINVRSSQDIEKLIGVVSYITSLFAENGVNIIEFLSCWKDTILVIDRKDVNKVIGFLEF